MAAKKRSPTPPETPIDAALDSLPAPPGMSVHDAARALADKGYHVIPLIWKSKAAIHRDWQHLTLTPDEIEAHFPRDSDLNLGLLLGSEVMDRVYLVAFDVDLEDPLLIERVRIAVGPTVRKKGAKGLTLIARTDKSYAKRQWKRKVNDKPVLAVELLGQRIQTVLPPSIHPTTGEPYVWLGEPLWDVPPMQLAFVTDWTMDEVELAVKNPDSPLFALNDMAWYGPGKGGTVDSSLLSATGVMVQRGWPDDAIYARCDRAVRICLNRHAEVRHEWSDAEHQRRVRSMVEDARKKGFDEQKPKKMPKDRLMAEWLVSELGGMDNVWGEEGGFIRTYRDGHWVAPNVQEVSHRLWVMFPDANGTSIEAAYRMLARCSPSRGRSTAKRICLQNGTFDLDDGALRPWSRDDLLLAQLPFIFDPEAKCPAYDAFMQQTFAHPSDGGTEKAIACFEEFLGYSLINDRSMQRMLVIKGQPKTGKSTLLKLMGMLHDRSAMSFVPISNFSKESYLSHMDGKLINCASEVHVLASVDDETLKRIIAGDEVTVRRLYNAPVDVELTARIVVACNEMFKTNDASGALERRILILSCDNRIEKVDPFFLNRLKTELPGIFNRIAAAVQRLYERGEFDPPSYIQQELQEFREDNNPVTTWYQDRTHEGRCAVDPEHINPKAEGRGTHTIDLYADYVEWAKLNGHKQMSAVTWGHRLRNLGYAAKASRIAGRLIKARQLHLIDTGAGY